MWSIREANHLYVFHNGELIYKRWLKKDGVTKTQPSVLFNKYWPNEQIV